MNAVTPKAVKTALLLILPIFGFFLVNNIQQGENLECNIGKYSQLYDTGFLNYTLIESKVYLDQKNQTLYTFEGSKNRTQCTDKRKVLLIFSYDAPDFNWKSAFGSSWKFIEHYLGKECLDVRYLMVPFKMEDGLDLLDWAEIALVKSNWGWFVDADAKNLFTAFDEKNKKCENFCCHFRKGLVSNHDNSAVGKRCGPSRVLIVSGVSDPQLPGFYDVLTYEVKWYEHKIKHLPHKQLLSFGLDLDVFQTIKNKFGDFKTRPFKGIWVGSFGLYKRMQYLYNFKDDGPIVAINSAGNSETAQNLMKYLQCQNTNVNFKTEPVVYEILAQLYLMSEAAYVTMPIDGGGERFVLEAKAAGLDLYIAEDNPKLIELARGPLLDKRYYAATILEAMALGGVDVTKSLSCEDLAPFSMSEFIGVENC